MAIIKVIAQNFDIYEGDGHLDMFARTGEISLKHIVRAGAEGVILGHSETGDEPKAINKKLLSLVRVSGIGRVVILIGESWKEFEGNSPRDVADLMKRKCDIIFRDVPKEFLSKIIVGYEPKWGSRGSGRDDMPPPQTEFISSCIKNMRLFFRDKYGYGDDSGMYFIYGGRSTPERTRKILADKSIDGLILGSACNNVKKTMDIANTMKDVCSGRTKVLICNFKAYDLDDSYEKYVLELGRMPDDFLVYLAPAYTDIRPVRDVVDDC